MNIKSLKTQFIGAIAMVLVAAIAMGSSTYAWFAMNTKVNVTGMQVKTTVSNNLLITADTHATNPANLTTYKSTLVTTLPEAILEPVSSIDGKDDSFWYTSTKNVGATGNANEEEYVQYDPDNTTAFETNYVTGAKGYAEYKFTLKAVNAEEGNHYVDITGLDLKYGGSIDAADQPKAFRVAILTKAYDPTADTPAWTTYDNLTTLSVSGAGYFGADNDSGDAEAVISANGFDEVVHLGTDALIDTITTKKTMYYEVTIRLWIEGEDPTCTTETFANLSEDWSLDVNIELQNTTNHGSNEPIDVIATTYAAKADLSVNTITIGTETLLINGITYTRLMNSSSNTPYWINTPTFTAATRYYTIADGVHPYDVTNQVTPHAVS